VGGDVGDVDDLGREEMRQRVEAPEELFGIGLVVEAAHVGQHRPGPQIAHGKGRGDEGQVVGIEHPGHGREGRGQDKDEELVAGDVHTHGLGRLLGGVQGAQGPADAAVQQIHGQPDDAAQRRGHNAEQGHVLLDLPAEQRQPRNADETGRATGHGHGLGEKDGQNDAEPQGGHGQIVAFQL